MPTYEYRCPKGHTFDVFQKMSDEPVAVCPECGEPAERQISPGAGFLFKGEGFYITDYRSKDYKERAKSEQPGKPSTEKKNEGGNGGSASSSRGESSGGSSGSASGPGAKGSSGSDD